MKLTSKTRYCLTGALFLSTTCALGQTVSAAQVSNASNDLMSTRLQGGASFDAWQTKQDLQKFKRLNADLQKATLVLMAELQNQQVVVALGPNYFSNVGVIVTPAVPRPDGMLRLGNPKPVSQNVLATLLIDIRNKVVALRACANAIHFPSDDLLASQWTAVTAVLEDMIKHNNDLALVAQNAHPKRLAIGQQAIRIYDDTKQMKHPLNDVFGTVADLGKRETGLASRQQSTY